MTRRSAKKAVKQYFSGRHVPKGRRYQAIRLLDRDIKRGNEKAKRLAVRTFSNATTPFIEAMGSFVDMLGDTLKVLQPLIDVVGNVPTP